MLETDRSNEGATQLEKIVKTCIELIDKAAKAAAAYRDSRPRHQELIRLVSRQTDTYDIVIGKTPEEVEKEKLDALFKELHDSVESFLPAIKEMVTEAINTPVSSIESNLLIRMRAMIVKSLAEELGTELKTTQGSGTIYPDSIKFPLIYAVEKLGTLAAEVRLKPGETALTTAILDEAKKDLVQKLTDVKMHIKSNTLAEWMLQYQCVDPNHQGAMDSLRKSLRQEESEQRKPNYDDRYADMSHFDMPQDTRMEAIDFYQGNGTSSMVGYYKVKIREVVEAELSALVASFELR